MLDKKFFARVIFDVIIILGIILVFAGGFLLYQEYWHDGTETEEAVEQLEDEETEDDIVDFEIEVEETGRYPAEIVDPDDRFSLSNRSLYLPGEEEVEFVEINIPDGANALRVGQILEQAGLMEFEEFTRLQLKFDFSTDIRAGDYTFSQEASSADILEEIIL